MELYLWVLANAITVNVQIFDKNPQLCLGVSSANLDIDYYNYYYCAKKRLSRVELLLSSTVV